MSGTYDGLATVRSGTEAAPITIEAAPGASVVIDGPIDVLHDYIIINGHYRIDHKDSAFTDRSATTEQGQDGIDISGHHVKIANLLTHDFRQGIMAAASVDDLTLYGNLVYFCGYDSANGHGFYIQNTNPWKKFVGNIVFHNLGYGLHLWGASGDIDYMWLEKNVAFCNGLLPVGGPKANIQLSGQSGGTGHKLFENIGYGAAHTVGYGIGNAVTATEIYDNRFCYQARALGLVDCTPDRLDGNDLYGATEGFVGANWPDNNYGDAAEYPDAAILTANQYDEDCATLTIFNGQADADNVSVDVSSLYNAGDTLEVHNVQDFFGDIQTLTVQQNGTIAVNMQAGSRTIATPQGWAVAPATTFPAFGCFVLIHT